MFPKSDDADRNMQTYRLILILTDHTYDGGSFRPPRIIYFKNNNNIDFELCSLAFKLFSISKLYGGDGER